MGFAMATAVARLRSPATCPTMTLISLKGTTLRITTPTEASQMVQTAEYCGYAVMMEAAAFHFRTAYLNTTLFWDENDGRVPVVLNWVVGNETCDVASKKADLYACRSNNSKCIDSSNGIGYLCNCTDEYDGNPYLTDGCKGAYCKFIMIDAFKYNTHLACRLIQPLQS
jgi:hypothetical protein